jgi:YgiT-type zinc finger domain-containing protein
MTNSKENQKCHYCGSEHFEERRVRYIYSRDGKHQFVPDMPADVCLKCDMIYYHGPALLKVEQRFKAIYQNIVHHAYFNSGLYLHFGLLVIIRKSVYTLLNVRK